MAVTGQEKQTSKKSKHKKVSDNANINASNKNVSRQRSVSEEEKDDDSETDLDTPVSQSKHFEQHSKMLPNQQNSNGDSSDSDTDTETSPRQSVSTKSNVRAQSEESRQSRSEGNEPDSDDDESEDEPQSMSLLQMHTAKISPGSGTHQGSKSPHISNSQSSHTSGATPRRFMQRPSVPEMSPSEAESDSDSEEEEETVPHHPPQPQPQPETESEEEEEEQPESALNPSVTVKEEVPSPSESSSFEEEEKEEEDTPHPVEKTSSLQWTTNRSRTVSVQRDMSPRNFSSPPPPRQLASFSTFEQEHTPLSAPVIDIPADSRVWVLQVPHSIPASHLKKQRLPGKLKGGEVLNLPSGCWQIREQPFDSSKSVINCIVSTGELSYGMLWFQPEAFWYLKQVPTPAPVENPELSWNEEVTPLPIKELLRMKSNPTRAKVMLKTPSKKQARNLSSELPSKRLKTQMEENVDISHQLPPKKKKKKKLYNNSSYVDLETSVMEPVLSKSPSLPKKEKHHHSVGTSHVNEQSMVQVDETKKGKKRKRTPELEEESPTLKKKKREKSVSEGNQSLLENTQSDWDTSGAQANLTMSSATEGNSFSKAKKKKKKHKESGDESMEKLRSPVQHDKINQVYTANDEGRKHSLPFQQEENYNGKKQKKKSRIERETSAVEDQYKGMHDNRESKKKGKKNSELEDSFKVDERIVKKEITDPSTSTSTIGEGSPKKHKKKHSQESETSFTETDTSTSKKKKKHYQKVEAEILMPETNEDNDTSVVKKKKKKHKHKDYEQVKVKQEVI